jgi:hypothetical protein
MHCHVVKARVAAQEWWPEADTCHLHSSLRLYSGLGLFTCSTLRQFQFHQVAKNGVGVLARSTPN